MSRTLLLGAVDRYRPTTLNNGVKKCIPLVSGFAPGLFSKRSCRTSAESMAGGGMLDSTRRTLEDLSLTVLRADTYDLAHRGIRRLTGLGWIESVKVPDQYIRELEPDVSVLVNHAPRSVALFVSSSSEHAVGDADRVLVEVIEQRTAARTKPLDPGERVWREWNLDGTLVSLGRHGTKAPLGKKPVPFSIQLQLEYER